MLKLFEERDLRRDSVEVLKLLDPFVDKHGRVVFKVEALNVKSLIICGDFNGSNKHIEYQASSTENGLEWVLKLKLNFGKHSYIYIFNSEWCLSPPGFTYDKYSFAIFYYTADGISRRQRTDSDENVFCDATFSRIVTMNAEQLYKIYTTAKLAHEKEKEKKPKNVDPEAPMDAVRANQFGTHYPARAKQSFDVPYNEEHPFILQFESPSKRKPSPRGQTDQKSPYHNSNLQGSVSSPLLGTFSPSPTQPKKKEKTLPTSRMSSTKQQRENRLSLEGKLDKSTVLEKQAEKDAMAASKQERERERNEHQLPFLLSSNESESDSTEDIFDDAYGDDVSKKKQRNSLSGDDLKRWSLPHLSSSHDAKHTQARDFYPPHASKKKHRLSKGYSPLNSPPSNAPHNPTPFISPITTPLNTPSNPMASGRPVNGLSLSSSLPLPMEDLGPSSSPPRESSSSGGKDRFSPMVFFSEARNSVAQSITHLASSISTILKNSSTSDFLFGDSGSYYKPNHQPMIVDYDDPLLYNIEKENIDLKKHFQTITNPIFIPNTSSSIVDGEILTSSAPTGGLADATPSPRNYDKGKISDRFKHDKLLTKGNYGSLTTPSKLKETKEKEKEPKYDARKFYSDSGTSPLRERKSSFFDTLSPIKVSPRDSQFTRSSDGLERRDETHKPDSKERLDREARDRDLRDGTRSEQLKSEGKRRHSEQRKSDGRSRHRVRDMSIETEPEPSPRNREKRLSSGRKGSFSERGVRKEKDAAKDKAEREKERQELQKEKERYEKYAEDNTSMKHAMEPFHANPLTSNLLNSSSSNSSSTGNQPQNIPTTFASTNSSKRNSPTQRSQRGSNSNIIVSPRERNVEDSSKAEERAERLERGSGAKKTSQQQASPKRDHSPLRVHSRDPVSPRGIVINSPPMENSPPSVFPLFTVSDGGFGTGLPLTEPARPRTPRRTDSNKKESPRIKLNTKELSNNSTTSQVTGDESQPQMLLSSSASGLGRDKDCANPNSSDKSNTSPNRSLSPSQTNNNSLSNSNASPSVHFLRTSMEKVPKVPHLDIHPKQTLKPDDEDIFESVHTQPAHPAKGDDSSSFIYLRDVSDSFATELTRNRALSNAEHSQWVSGHSPRYREAEKEREREREREESEGKMHLSSSRRERESESPQHNSASSIVNQSQSSGLLYPEGADVYLGAGAVTEQLVRRVSSRERLTRLSGSKTDEKSEREDEERPKEMVKPLILEPEEPEDLYTMQPQEPARSLAHSRKLSPRERNEHVVLGVERAAYVSGLTGLDGADEKVSRKSKFYPIYKGLEEDLIYQDTKKVDNDYFYKETITTGSKRTMKQTFSGSMEQLPVPTDIDWNTSFQALETQLNNLHISSNTSLLERYCLYRAINDLYENFVQTATVYGQLIISEIGIPQSQKTIFPSPRFGGIAGGEKYVVHGILFKFATDHKGIFNGNIEAAMKVAGHDLRSLIQISDLRIPDLRFPMMALVDYLGFRVVAESILPVNADTLKYGTSDGGYDIHMSSDVLADRMTQIGLHLNLAQHLVCARNDSKIHSFNTPIDLEGHELPGGNDLYALDYSRLFPPEQRPTAECRYTHLYRLLRPEFVKAYPKKHVLSSDSYSEFQYPRPTVNESTAHDEVLDEAVKMLHAVVIPQFAKDLDNSNADSDAPFLVQKLHHEGINCRHLGSVFAHVTVPTWHARIFIEMLSRLMKCKLQKIMRQTILPSPQQQASQTLRDTAKSDGKKKRFALSGETNKNERMGLGLKEVIHNIACYLNLVFGNSQESKTHWTATLRQELIYKYGSAWLEVCRESLWFRNTKLFPAVLKEVCALVGIVLTRDAKQAAMEFDFWLLDEPFDVVDFVTIEARIKQTTGGGASAANLLRIEAIHERNIQKKKKKFVLSLQQYQKILSVNPQCCHVLYHIGDCYNHMSYQMKTQTDRANYQKLAEQYYAAAYESNQRDYLAAHKYALFLEFHKGAVPMDVKKIESLYYTCIVECPLYAHGLFDYGKFLFTRCNQYHLGIEFMTFGAIESSFQDSYKEQIQNFVLCCDLNGIFVDKSRLDFIFSSNAPETKTTAT